MRKGKREKERVHYFASSSCHLDYYDDDDDDCVLMMMRERGCYPMMILSLNLHHFTCNLVFKFESSVQCPVSAVYVNQLLEQRQRDTPLFASLISLHFAPNNFPPSSHPHHYNQYHHHHHHLDTLSGTYIPIEITRYIQLILIPWISY